MENFGTLAVGALLLIIGIVNMSGNISTIHSYNRKRVTEADIPKYGKAVGMGTVIIGCALIANALLVMLGFSEAVPFVLIPAISIGLIIILYAQIKYNKGIF